MQPLTQVPNTNGLTPEEALKKISSYLQSLKRDVEYGLENAEKSGGGVSKEDLSGLFDELGINETNIEYWNRITKITNELGNIIGSKIEGNIDNANILISSMKDKILRIIDGTTIEDSTWCMELSPAGFRISKERIYDADTNSYHWNFRTFGTGEGFTADEITAGEINGLTIRACDIVAGNMTSGTVTGVKIKGNTIEGNDITGGTIEGTTITGSRIEGTIIEGNEINGGKISGTEINAATVNASTFNTSIFNAPTISAGTFTGGLFEGAEFRGNTIIGSEIYGGTITGAIVQSVSDNGGGVVIKDNGYGIYADTEAQRIYDETTGEFITVPGEGKLAGQIYYDTNGAGTVEEAKDRVFFGTHNGYALKMYSDADMSIEAKGQIFIKGDVRFTGTTNIGLLFSDKIVWKDDGLILDDKYYLTITDTYILCHNTGERVNISTSSGSVSEAFLARSSN